MKKYSTKRLILRPWQKDDLEFLYELGNNTLVMEYLDDNGTTMDNTVKLLNAYQNHFLLYGFGPMVVLEQNSGNYVGGAVIRYIQGVPHLESKVEIGWRLNNKYWGKGLANEISNKCLKFRSKNMDYQK